MLHLPCSETEYEKILFQFRFNKTSPLETTDTFVDPAYTREGTLTD